MAATLRTTNSSPGAAEKIEAGSTRLSAHAMIMVRVALPLGQGCIALGLRDEPFITKAAIAGSQLGRDLHA